MKFWFDTEFIEDGKTIDLMSIGIVAEDGREFYAESSECDLSRASQWVRENVIPYLTGAGAAHKRIMLREGIRSFVNYGVEKDGKRPEFWAYYASYDWVALCQLYGTMMELPKGWPMYCRDVKQLCDDLGNPNLPGQDNEHFALADARWTKQAWAFLKTLERTPA